MDNRGILLISGVLALLLAATAATEFLRRRPSGVDAATLATCRSRLNAWWLLFGSLICALLLGTIATVFLFGAISFWALREYLTLTPTRPADHRTLVGVFFILTPLQFLLVGLNSEWFESVFGVGTYPVYSALIPTLAFLVLPAGVAASGDPKYFLERIAKLQVGLLICVYCLSYAPALLTTNLPNAKPTPSAATVEAVDLEDKVVGTLERSFVAIQTSATEAAEAPEAVAVETLEENGAISTPRRTLDSTNLTLLFAFVFLTQLSDMAQYLWSLVFPKHKIAPKINSNKTTEGALLGALTTALAAVGLWYFTPFPYWWQAALAGLIIAGMGFAGTITTSAIKRDRGVGDYGALVEGHNGVLDRIDSLCFAAPVFFHYVWICLM
ncbi:MAG: phosphatidate cytidylyltransferase [Thermoguttaceae bacterium]|nr:phosphatidate cytidylyltransferase [Thermoguttaceae bacterium]